MLWRVRDRAGAQPGILTRLDKDTSGLVVDGADAGRARAMQRDRPRAASTRSTSRSCRARLSPPRGTHRAAARRDPADRRRVVVTDAGAPSETRYEVIASARTNGRSLVRCELVTGRTHQIRVHLASRGWPIVGDALYGVSRRRRSRARRFMPGASLRIRSRGTPIDARSADPADMRS